MAYLAFLEASGVAAGVVAFPVAVCAAGGPFEADRIPVHARLIVGVATVAHDAVDVAGGLPTGAVAFPFSVGAACCALEAEGITIHSRLIVRVTAFTNLSHGAGRDD